MKKIYSFMVAAVAMFAAAACVQDIENDVPETTGETVVYTAAAGANVEFSENHMLHCAQVILRKLLWCRVLCIRKDSWGWINDKSNFDGVQDINVDWLEFGTLVGYMESHDEERTMFKAQSYGTESVKGDYKVRLKRAGLNAAFFLLVPGPKMIWQFGEIGYDYSINEGGDRTAKKPWVTDSYMDDPNRKALYDTYASLLKFRFDNPRFFDSDADFRWGVGASNTPGRYIFCTNDDGFGGRDTFVLFGNFGTGSQDVTITLPHEGPWYDYYTYDESVSKTEGVWNGTVHTPGMAEGTFFLLVDDPALCLNSR